MSGRGQLKIIEPVRRSQQNQLRLGERCHLANFASNDSNDKQVSTPSLGGSNAQNQQAFFMPKQKSQDWMIKSTSGRGKSNRSNSQISVGAQSAIEQFTNHTTSELMGSCQALQKAKDLL